MQTLKNDLTDGNGLQFIEMSEDELARYYRREIFGYDDAMAFLCTMQRKILASGTDGRATPRLYLHQYIPYSDEPPIDPELV